MLGVQISCTPHISRTSRRSRIHWHCQPATTCSHPLLSATTCNSRHSYHRRRWCSHRWVCKGTPSHYLPQPICQPDCLHVYQPACQSVCPFSADLSVRLFVYPCICLPANLPVSLSVYLRICLVWHTINVQSSQRLRCKAERTCHP
jgi:hypothetical protein